MIYAGPAIGGPRNGSTIASPAQWFRVAKPQSMVEHDGPRPTGPLFWQASTGVYRWEPFGGWWQWLGWDVPQTPKGTT